MVLTIQLLWILITLPYHIVGHVTWRQDFIFSSLVRDAKTFFFLNTTMSSTTTPILDEPQAEITIANVILAVAIFFVKLSFRLQHATLLTIFGTSCLTIWIAVNNFVKQVHPTENERSKLGGRTHKLEKIQESLDELVTLANSVNAIGKHASFWVILDASLYFSKDLDVIWKDVSYDWKTYFCGWILYLITFMILSAECFRKVPSSFISTQ